MKINKFEDKSQEELLDLLGSKSRHVGFIEVLEVINQNERHLFRHFVVQQIDLMLCTANLKAGIKMKDFNDM